MVLRVIGKRFTCAVTVLFMFFAQGCESKDPSALNEEDKKFAMFYADYLVLSGVAAGDSETVSQVGNKSLDSLFDAHALTLDDFNKRTNIYQQEPRLWKAVLLEVKKNLKQK